MTTLITHISAAWQAAQYISDVGWFWIAYFACAIYGWVAFVNWMVR